MDSWPMNLCVFYALGHPFMQTVDLWMHCCEYLNCWMIEWCMSHKLMNFCSLIGFHLIKPYLMLQRVFLNYWWLWLSIFEHFVFLYDFIIFFVLILSAICKLKDLCKTKILKVRKLTKKTMIGFFNSLMVFNRKIAWLKIWKSIQWIKSYFPKIDQSHPTKAIASPA